MGVDVLCVEGVDFGEGLVWEEGKVWGCFYLTGYNFLYFNINGYLRFLILCAWREGVMLV